MADEGVGKPPEYITHGNNVHFFFTLRTLTTLLFIGYFSDYLSSSPSLISPVEQSLYWDKIRLILLMLIFGKYVFYLSNFI